MKNENKIKQEAKKLFDRLDHSCTMSGRYQGKYCFVWYRPTRWAYNVDDLNELATLLAETRILIPRAPHYLDLLSAIQGLIKANAHDSTVDGEYILGYLPLHDYDAESVRPWMTLVLEYLANQ
jgi:hypothetical protein